MCMCVCERVWGGGKVCVRKREGGGRVAKKRTVFV